MGQQFLRSDRHSGGREQLQPYAARLAQELVQRPAVHSSVEVIKKRAAIAALFLLVSAPWNMGVDSGVFYAVVVDPVLQQRIDLAVEGVGDGRLGRIACQGQEPDAHPGVDRIMIAGLAQRLTLLVQGFQAHGVLVGRQRRNDREREATEERQDHLPSAWRMVVDLQSKTVIAWLLLEFVKDHAPEKP